jgi:succinyl-diaminopimelate desuccinylase
MGSLVFSRGVKKRRQQDQYMSIDQATAAAIHDFIAAQKDNMTAMLAELVKVPSDNPPGDCAPHARRAAELLEQLGFTVERHPVPEALVKENGMISAPT